MPSELFVSRIGGRTWAALREDGRVVELRVERAGRRVPAGRIVLGRVTRVVPAIQSAFLDIGESRDAFLHVSDLSPPSAAAPDAPIEQRLRAGSQLIVQVVRESPVGKGDRVSSQIALAGRLLVLLPHESKHGVSRRITDSHERERLLGCLAGVPARAGLVARTSAADAPAEAIEIEARRLLELWSVLLERAHRAEAPSVLHDPPATAVSLMRDMAPSELARVVTDDAEEHRQILAWIGAVEPELATQVVLQGPPPPLFESSGIDREIARALEPRVPLPSGGFVVIEPTEALVSIDVNTGRSVHGAGPESTVLETNLEAAVEIARQLRLRDLGGIIVIDFIDMASPAHRLLVVETFRGALARDRARSRIFGLGELGLLQLTRERVRTSLHDALTEACPRCGGSGHVPLP